MNDTDLLSRLRERSLKFDALSKQIKSLAKALDAAARTQLQSLKDVMTAARELETTRAEMAEADDIAALTEALNACALGLSRDGRALLLNALREKIGDNFTILSENPTVLQYSPFQVELDFENGEAKFCYARELFDVAKLHAEGIVACHEKCLAHFREIRRDSDSFWTLLTKAYDMWLIASDARDGERAEIHELLPFLTLLSGMSYPRYLLAYQLQKLRKDMRLAKGNRRLDLGTATGGSTKNKKRVLFIPGGGADGQYYLTLCFKKV